MNECHIYLIPIISVPTRVESIKISMHTAHIEGLTLSIIGNWSHDVFEHQHLTLGYLLSVLLLPPSEHQRPRQTSDQTPVPNGEKVNNKGPSFPVCFPLGRESFITRYFRSKKLLNNKHCHSLESFSLFSSVTTVRLYHSSTLLSPTAP